MSMVRYCVAVTLPNEATADRWLAWMRSGHVAEVLAGGALSAEIVRLDGPAIEFEARYLFPSRAAFDRYEREHAPRLRTEGLRLFPLEHGVRYRRSTGIVTDLFSNSK